MIGKVLDSSAVAAIAAGHHAAASWVTVAFAQAHILCVPTLALTEVAALRPDLALALEDLESHPSVITRTLTDPAEPVAADVEGLLSATSTFDVLAGHVVHVAVSRGWPALTADPGRLRRLAPDLEVTLV